jgi:hypothetical protein
MTSSLPLVLKDADFSIRFGRFAIFFAIHRASAIGLMDRPAKLFEEGASCSPLRFDILHLLANCYRHRDFRGRGLMNRIRCPTLDRASVR